MIISIIKDLLGGGSKRSIYYNNLGEGLIYKKVSPNVRKFIDNELLPRMKPLSAEKYWKEFAVYMMSAARQSYILHGDRCYWCIDCVHVVEMWEKGFRYAEVADLRPEEDEDENPLMDLMNAMGSGKDAKKAMANFEKKMKNRPEDPVYDMVFDSWDDIMEDRTDVWKRASSSIENMVDRCNKYSEKVHQTWSQKIPMEKLMEMHGPGNSGEDEE